MKYTKQKKYIYTYGLSDFELGALHVLAHRNYERFNCDENFDALLDGEAIGIFLDPHRLSAEQIKKLGEVYHGDLRTIIVLTEALPTRPDFYYSVISLKAVQDSSRTRVMRVLQDVSICSYFALRMDRRVERDVFGSEPAFVSLDICTSRDEEDAEEIVRIRVNYGLADRADWIIRPAHRAWTSHLEEQHGITKEQFEAGIPLEEAMRRLACYHAEAPIVCASELWVIDLLEKAGKKTGFRLADDRVFIDIFCLSRLLFSALYVICGELHTPAQLGKFLGITESDTFGDDRGIALIFRELRKILSDEYGLHTLAEASAYFEFYSEYMEAVFASIDENDVSEEENLARLSEAAKYDPTTIRSISEKKQT